VCACQYQFQQASPHIFPRMIPDSLCGFFPFFYPHRESGGAHDVCFPPSSPPLPLPIDTNGCAESRPDGTFPDSLCGFFSFFLFFFSPLRNRTTAQGSWGQSARTRARAASRCGSGGGSCCGCVAVRDTLICLLAFSLIHTHSHKLTRARTHTRTRTHAHTCIRLQYTHTHTYTHTLVRQRWR